jgi:hypothetical protein
MLQQLSRSSAAIIAILLLASLLIAFFIARFLFLRRVMRDGQCPQCFGVEFHRAHRSLGEKLLGYGTEVRRYRCANPECNWEGLRLRDRRSRRRAKNPDLPAPE